MTRSLALAAAGMLAACGHLDEVDVTRSASGTVPGAAGAPPLSGDVLGGIELVIDRRALAENGVDPDDVDSARLVSLRLEVTQGTPLPAWLDSVRFFVERPGEAPVLLAEKTGIRSLPPGATAVDLDVAGVDLKPYTLSDSARVTGQASGTQPPQDTTILATATIRVDVNVSGLFH
jgi:hypothetical protein